PAGMFVEPAEHGSQTLFFLRLILFRQVEDIGIAESSKIDSKVCRRPRTDEKEPILVITRLTPCVLNRQPCLSYATQSMDRLASGETNHSPPTRHESLPEIYKLNIATFKERTQGVVRKIGDPAWRFGAAGWEPQFLYP